MTEEEIASLFPETVEDLKKRVAHLTGLLEKALIVLPGGTPRERELRVAIMDAIPPL
jgi:hypothetical protein